MTTTMTYWRSVLTGEVMLQEADDDGVWVTNPRLPGGAAVDATVAEYNAQVVEGEAQIASFTQLGADLTAMNVVAQDGAISKLIGLGLTEDEATAAVKGLSGE